MSECPATEAILQAVEERKRAEQPYRGRDIPPCSWWKKGSGG